MKPEFFVDSSVDGLPSLMPSSRPAAYIISLTFSSWGVDSQPTRVAAITSLNGILSCIGVQPDSNITTYATVPATRSHVYCRALPFGCRLVGLVRRAHAVKFPDRARPLRRGAGYEF